MHELFSKAKAEILAIIPHFLSKQKKKNPPKTTKKNNQKNTQSQESATAQNEKVLTLVQEQSIFLISG